MSEPQQPPNATPSYPQSGAPVVPPTIPPAPQGAGMANIALVLALVAVFGGIVIQFVIQAMIMQIAANPSAIGLVALFSNIIIGLLCIGAILCAVVAFRPAQPGRARAGIAVGIAGATLVGILSSFLVSMLAPLFS